MTGSIGPLPAGLAREDLLAEVSRALEIVRPRGAVVVALSGGADSTALAYLVVEARPDLEVTLAHIRHGLRDDRDDVATVTAHADALGAPLVIRQVEVVPVGEGLEAAARHARHEALFDIATTAGARWVLLGHTADDQAETVLMRIARGTGVSGLAGMAPVSPPRLRPLLRVRRADLRRFVTHEGLSSVEDPMNRDRAFRRVRARQEVLPALEAIGEDVVGALCRLADLAREDAGTLDEEAAEVAAADFRSYGPLRALRDARLGAVSPAIARRVVRELLSAVRESGHPVDAAAVGSVLSMAPGAALDLPGARVSRGGGWLAAAPPDDQGDRSPRPLVVPGRTPWPAAGIAVRAVVAGREPDSQTGGDPGIDWEPPAVTLADRAIPPGGSTGLGQVVLGPSAAAGLVLRGRRPGDRMATRAGGRKLQDLLVDAGVPRVARDLLPIVARGERILWVPGIAVDAAAAEEARETPAVHLAVVPETG